MVACMCVTLLGYALASYIAARWLLFLYNVIYPHFISSGPSDLASFSGGKWAVVTGSTDGIGKGYAFELARRGMNVVLIARNQEKLTAVKNEINEKYPKVDVRTVVFDFTEHSIEAYERMYKDNGFDKLDVGVLVNNVGMSYDHPDYFHEVPLTKLRNLVLINTLSVVAMCNLFLPAMRQRKSGVIVNLSSGSDIAPTPLVAVYAATKIFVRYLTTALSREYANDNVTVQTVVPLYVATNMSRIRRTSFFVPSAMQFARSAVNTIGVQQCTHGYWTHQLQGALMAMLPSFVLERVAMGMLEKTRVQAIRKKNKQQ